MTEESVRNERKLQIMFDDTKKRIEELGKVVDVQVRKMQEMTKESPGTAVTVAFVGGLLVGGIVTLLLTRNKD